MDLSVSGLKNKLLMCEYNCRKANAVKGFSEINVLNIFFKTIRKWMKSFIIKRFLARKVSTLNSQLPKGFGN
jgi:hypothetical protein